jgi:hypothetical protein
MRLVYLIVGCPGSGKTWITDQLKTKYDLVKHDMQSGMTGAKYAEHIKVAADTSDKPILAEAPFSISEIKEPLEKDGIEVRPVFIQEADGMIEARYRYRENKEIPAQHIARQKTYASRAREYGAFSGTSEQVLKHLQKQTS